MIAVNAQLSLKTYNILLNMLRNVIVTKGSYVNFVICVEHEVNDLVGIDA